MSVEEFFYIGEYEISNDFQKMNFTQQKETIHKSINIRFISLSFEVSQQQEFIVSDKKKYQIILGNYKIIQRNFEIENKRNVQEKEFIQQQYQVIYLKCQPKENKDILFQTVRTNQHDEDLIKRINQCKKICEEIQRLQEENDNLQVALEAEVKHKSSLQKLKQSKYIKDGNTHIQLSLEHNQELETIQINLIYNFSVELESRVLYEKIKQDQDQKQKDCQKRIKFHLQQKTKKYEQREGKLQLFELKEQDIKIRQRNQNLICDQANNICRNKNYINNEISKANSELHELKQKLEKLEYQQDQREKLLNQFNVQQKQLKIQQLELIKYDQQNTINILEKHILLKKIEKLIKWKHNPLLAYQNWKRLNFRIIYQIVEGALRYNQKYMQQALGQILQYWIQYIKELLLFSTIKQILSDVQKKEDSSYILYMQVIVTEFKNQKEIIALQSA
ncbi:unnamed protein product [Paramecium primaurelia]|uniref:Uncharacterized protein n=1 Tax=Paramecium primaurelia TaxID=5886 RepID=A0A8S1KK95_PARPR|nr:unnamed protein product [Paramecium primaurelia]